MYNSMYNQSRLFTGITPLQKENAFTPFYPVYEKDGKSEYNIYNKYEWKISNEKSKGLRTPAPFYEKGFIQQKAGLGILPVEIPSNFIGTKFIPYNQPIDLSARINAGLDKVNSSKSKIPENKILYTPNNPTKFM